MKTNKERIADLEREVKLLQEAVAALRVEASTRRFTLEPVGPPPDRQFQATRPRLTIDQIFVT